MILLSEHFTLDEFTRSDLAIRHGIDNTPSPEVINNLKKTAALLEEVRFLFNKPIVISSGYRCAVVNTLVNGAANSAHVLGLAVDFTIPRYGDPYKVCKAISQSDMDFDQLILEYDSWVHIGLAAKNRKQLLTKRTNTKYLPGIIRAN